MYLLFHDLILHRIFHNLYEIVFKEEVPEQFKRDPNEILDDIINAIYDNKKIIH